MPKKYVKFLILSIFTNKPEIVNLKLQIDSSNSIL
jgi:hypothetical protein